MISTEPSDNMREILQNIAKSHGVSNMRKLGHLNNFVKVVQLLFVLVVVQRLVYATLMHDFSVEIWSCVIRCLHLFFFALILGEICWIVNVNMVECIKWSWEYYVLIDHWKHCKMSTNKIKFHNHFELCRTYILSYDLHCMNAYFVLQKLFKARALVNRVKY